MEISKGSNLKKQKYDYQKHKHVKETVHKVEPPHTKRKKEPA